MKLIRYVGVVREDDVNAKSLVVLQDRTQHSLVLSHLSQKSDRENTDRENTDRQTDTHTHTNKHTHTYTQTAKHTHIYILTHTAHTHTHTGTQTYFCDAGSRLQSNQKQNLPHIVKS